MQHFQIQSKGHNDKIHPRMHQIAAFFFLEEHMLALAYNPHRVICTFSKKNLLISRVLVRSLEKTNFTRYKC